MSELIRRRLEDVTRQRMTESPVVLLQGPRSVGKSTLLRALAGRFASDVVDLDDPAVSAAVAGDPGLFVSGSPPVFLDEYQRVPEVLDAIKAELNRDGSPGRFVLAGSTRFDALPPASQALTGRLQRIEILPFSQGEIDGQRETLLERLLEDPAAVMTPRPSTTSRDEYARRIARGGFPLALTRTDDERDRWLDDYVALSLERDLLEQWRVRRPSSLAPLLTRLAAQTGLVLNVSAAAKPVGLSTSSAIDYARLFESNFLVRLLPAWGRTLLGNTATRPKLHIVDSGVAARLLRLSPGKLAALDRVSLVQFEYLLKTFVVGEVLKQASWMDYRPHVGHWRTHNSAEVDLIVEDGRDGSVLGIEVKAGSRIRPVDIYGLRKLRDLLSDRFKAGLVLYTGPHCISLGDEDRLYALPIDHLWTQPPT